MATPSLGIAPAPSRKRFTVIEDLCLLREIVGRNPFAAPERWADILTVLVTVSGRDFSMRAVRERADLLLEYFRQQDTAQLRKSGTEEQYGEKEQLLQEVSDLAREFGHRTKTMPRKRTTGGSAPKGLIRGRPSAAARLRAAKAARTAATVCASTSWMPATGRNESLEECVTPTSAEDESQAQRLLLQAYDGVDEEREVHAALDDSASATAAASGHDESRRTANATRKKSQQTAEMDFLERRAEQELTREDRRLALDERSMALQERRMALEEMKYYEEAQSRAEAREALAEERRAQAQERQQQADERRVHLEERRAAAEERRVLAAQQELQIQLLLKLNAK